MFSGNLHLRQNKLKCTYLCKLTTCSNQKDDDEEEFEHRDVMDDYDYDEDDGSDV